MLVSKMKHFGSIYRRGFGGSRNAIASIHVNRGTVGSVVNARWCQPPTPGSNNNFDTQTRWVSIKKRRRRPKSTLFQRLHGTEDEDEEEEGRNNAHMATGETTMNKPFEVSGGDFHEYMKKANLSPWVPVPDPVARKMLELGKANKDSVRIGAMGFCGRLGKPPTRHMPRVVVICCCVCMSLER